MKSVKIVDCTLREGGYLNNWEFGKEFCLDFISKLSKAKVEHIEVGFLTDGNFGENQTLFNQIEDINKIIPNDNTSKICAMIMVDEFDINKIIPKNKDIKLDCIRVGFKKYQIDKIDSYINKAKECGYEVFVNPTYIDEYNDLELIELFEKINKYEPNFISLVDTNGFLKEKDIARIIYLMKEYFFENIYFCFHLHNNLYRAFENVKVAIKETLNKRAFVIDATILGMGRGVGNLQSELICSYLNENCDKNYNLKLILELLDEKIYPYLSLQLCSTWFNVSCFQVL